MKTTVPHPTLPVTLTYDPVPHTYTDQDGDRYTSVTTLVESCFPAFDTQAAAAKKAQETGRLELDILAEWKAKELGWTE